MPVRKDRVPSSHEILNETFRSANLDPFVKFNSADHLYYDSLDPDSAFWLTRDDLDYRHGNVNGPRGHAFLQREDVMDVVNFQICEDQNGRGQTLQPHLAPNVEEGKTEDRTQRTYHPPTRNPTVVFTNEFLHLDPVNTTQNIRVSVEVPPIEKTVSVGGIGSSKTDLASASDHGVTPKVSTRPTKRKTPPGESDTRPTKRNVRSSRPDNGAESSPKSRPNSGPKSKAVTAKDESKPPITRRAADARRLQLGRNLTAADIFNKWPGHPAEWVIVNHPNDLIGGTLLATGEGLVDACIPTGKRFAGRGPHIYDRILHYHGKNVVLSEQVIKKAWQFAKDRERVDEETRRDDAEFPRCTVCAAQRIQCSMREQRDDELPCQQCRDSGNRRRCKAPPEGFYHHTRESKIER